MSGRHAHRAHLVQHDGHAGARDLPCGLRPCEPTADDVDGFHRAHALAVSTGTTCVFWKATMRQLPPSLAMVIVGRAVLFCISSNSRGFPATTALSGTLLRSSPRMK